MSGDVQRYFVTTTIPYVNARPHLGFALELVQADVLARHRRARGVEVRFLSGTDENSLKNVLAAEAEGVAVADLVDRNAAAFEQLRGPLALSFDDFIRTSRDPRHRVGVAELWRRCAEAGDFYRQAYTGLYCVGCESFYTEDELVGEGVCPEHLTRPQTVTEENWFFRLSRYQRQLEEAISGGRLRIEPESRRNEVLALVRGGLRDFSVSRSVARARGWGIPVPGDPEQVVYVWWDALGNYVSSLGFGSGDPEFARWWEQSRERVHLVGKGVLRFHAVYWPAMLLSAGLPLPTRVLVHDYLTVDGRKISKSLGGAAADPAELVRRYGTDAVRWWLLREVPRVGDADFTEERLIARADADLAGGFGNLVHRVVTMVHRYRGGVVPEAARVTTATAELGAVCARASGRVDAALDRFDYRGAVAAVWTLVEEANRCIDRTRPWELAKAGRDGELDAALAALVRACRELVKELAPFLPGAAARLAELLAADPATGRLPVSRPPFTRLGPDKS